MGRSWSRLTFSQLFYLVNLRRLLFTQVIAFFFLSIGIQNLAQAACGATNRQWINTGGGNNKWTTTGNWSGGNIPNATNENAIILSGGKVPNLDASQNIGCLDIQSGSMTMTTAATTLTISGDYFRNNTAGSLTMTTGGTVGVIMAGTAAQTFENYDLISNITISNNTSVTFTNPFSIQDSLTLSGTTTTLYINANVTLNFAGAFTIPAGVTVVIGNGATLTTTGNITVNGTLTVDGGGRILMANASTLTVAATGLLNLNGTNGNVAAIETSAGSTFNLTVNGSMQAAYFRISRPSAAGVNLVGTLISMNDGEFHNITSKCMTVGASASLPSTLDNMSFFNELAVGSPINIDAAAYTGTATTLNNWSGDIGGATYESDAGNKVSWGSQAGVSMSLANMTAVGSPPATIGQSVTSYMATLGFSLNQTAVTTNILTIVTLTIDGTANAGDINYIQVYKDTAGGTSCVYDAGVDTQVGSNMTVSGSPTVSGSIDLSGDNIAISSTTPVCLHFLIRTSATAVGGRTVGIKILSTADIVNSQNYPFTPSSGPPVSAGTSTIIGSPLSTWSGGANPTPDRWTQNSNWLENTAPSATRDCRVGTAAIFPILIAAATCQNATLQTSGQIDFNGAKTLNVAGSLDIGSTYTFQNATTAIINMNGTNNQTISTATTWPGILTIANTGAAGSNTVSLASNVTVTGALNVNSGVLQIPNGFTLTVGGNVTVASGATLDIQPGGVLKFSTDESVLTVNAGGTLELIGSSSSAAQITSSSTAIDYWINVNGTIKAQYYSLTHLGVNGANSGLTIQSGATIDTTYHLLDGSFNYPVDNSTKLLRLFLKVPPADTTEALNNCAFNANGSAATGVVNVYTDAAVAAGTLTMNSFSGDLSGETLDAETNYLVSWGSPTNTIDLTQEATSPASVNQGQTYNMGRFGFKQTQAGAFANTDITSLKLTLTGTGTSSDVSQVRIYWDSGCTGSGGTLLGSGTFSGVPATKTFAIGAGSATVPFAAVAPTLKRCIYVEYDISGTAVNAKTVGVQIAGATDIVNSQTYAISGSTPPPVTLGSASTIIGTTSTWTGATNTNWFTAGNWNGGVPTSTINCTIPSAANNPAINAAGAVCKNVNITTGNLSISTTDTLEVYGDFLNTGTFSQNTGALSIRDDGVTATNQNIKTGSATVTLTTSSKTAGGTIVFSGASIIANSPFTLSGANSFDMTVPNSASVTFNNGLTVSGRTFTINGGGTVKFPSGQALTVSGGNLTINGTNDVFEQTSTNKGKITNVSGATTWSFSATSGTVSLTGFWLDYLDANGLQITGTAQLSTLDGGQFTNLATNGTGLTLNTSGTVDTTPTNVGFEWGAFNAYLTGTTCLAGTYKTVNATTCGAAGTTVTFSEWFGNWWPGYSVGVSCTPEDHITDDDSGVTGCNVSMAASASPVTLSSLSATPYNAAVSVDWQTASELDHKGFNVYRTTDPATGAIQINGSLIRNINSSGSAAGTYRFVDSTVTNGTSYFYYLEDVAYDGTRKMHGPVSATPQSTLANAPATPGGTNGSGSSGNPNAGNGPGSGTIGTPGSVDLGNGVHLISQTKSSLRIEIVPPTESYTASTLATYQVLNVPGYAHTTTAGSPELVERVILVEVDSGASAAVVGSSSITEGANSSRKIQPAPTYNLSGGVLVPTYTVDAAVYATNSYMPSTYYSVDSSTTSLGGKKYVKITATPFRYNPSTQDMKKATRIVLDIGINGGVWSTPTPPVEIARSPALVDGNLRIRYNKTGLYEVSYDQMAAAGVEGPFAGTSTSTFRLYMNGVEVPMEIISANGTFNSGDALRFYGYFSKPLDDNENEVVLSRLNLLGSSSAPLRFTAANADPTGVTASPETYVWMNATADLDWQLYEDPYGSSWDHFYAEILRKAHASMASPEPEITLAVPLELPYLAQDSTTNVRLKVSVKGLRSRDLNGPHHLGVWANGTPYMVADVKFNGDEAMVLNLEIPANYLFAGTNTLTLRALADTVNPDNYDRIMIDRIYVDYKGMRRAVDGYIEIWNGYLDTKVSINNLPNNSTVNVYDVTDLSDVLKLTNVSYATSDGGATYTATFAALAGSQYTHGRRFIAVDDASVMTVSSLRLAYGANMALGVSVNQADLIVVGSEEMLTAAAALIARREAEGLTVIGASLEQIYAEFGHGLRSSQAIRDFVQYAYNNWQKPAPRYLLLLGDATADPNDYLGYGKNLNNFPIHWQTGDYMDFAGDSWYVMDDGNTNLLLAVGRIPAANSVELDNYITKLLAHEDAFASMTVQTNKFTFVTDKSEMSEDFAAKTQAMANTLSQAGGVFTTTIIDRTGLSDAAMQTAVTGAFSNDSFVLAFIGHGAEDRWMNDQFINPILGVTEASALANTSWPLVMGLNCNNGKFYDVYMPTLGESLVMNKSGGAIAFWGPSTMTSPEVQVALAQAFFNELNGVSQQAYSVVRLGDVTTRAKLAISGTPSNLVTVRSWEFLGDPTMRVPPSVFSAQSTDLSSTDEGKKGNGFLSCGSIGRGGSNGRNGSSWGDTFSGLLEMLVLIGMLFAASRSGRLPLRLHRLK